MPQRVDAQRLDFGIGVLGGPTTVIDIGGLRLVTDPTFDPAGDHAYLTKLNDTSVPAAELGPVDAVLVSHDVHADNLDDAGREFALAAPKLITGPISAARLGSSATGVATWETVSIPRGDGAGDLTVRALPAVHGPADAARDEDGNVLCEVTGFLLSGDDLPTVYVSGDNASIGVVAEVARRYGPVDVALLFIGAARVPARERGRPLTLTSQQAAAAAAVLGASQVVPAHYDSWAHFSENGDRVTEAFDDAGLATLLHMSAPGEWDLIGR
ncbi:MAG TPA: MBL fold metallo-hydrolase [Pseudonocardiaceae bacterium]|jgi:L-ascorbate metabolism protein UlaG (beta-lactamase superfamily)